MQTIHKPNWHIPENHATPEHIFLNRRQFLTTTTIAASAALIPNIAQSATEPPDKTLNLYPAKQNPAYKLNRDITPINVTSKYNNFYEFGSHKRIATAAQALKTRPWDITIEGEVQKPITISIDDLIRKMPLEERLYRHRCVEAWAMAVPWTGFAFSELLKLADPKPSAKFVEMQTFYDPSIAGGQKQIWYPWPYKEGLTIAEAANELTFLATGIYGKPLLKQFGAPLRLAVPWKYGFKSIKSITRFRFTTARPVSFWEDVQPKEYGFWANVNPEVPHPRWSQASEELIGTGRRVPTKLYNGYGEQVAHLYKEGDSLGLTLWR